MSVPGSRHPRTGPTLSPMPANGMVQLQTVQLHVAFNAKKISWKKSRSNRRAQSQCSDMTSSPSVGERAAISGYTLQYLIAADLVYAQICSGTLEWVQLVDPDAGRVDDVIIATPGWIDAYQVKWAQSKSTYTFGSFTTSKDKKPSLWKQLSDGWQSMQLAHPDRQARVSFVSNEIASPNDKVPDSGGSKIAFQELWTEALVPIGQGLVGPESVLPKYDAALVELERMTDLGGLQFGVFLSRCRLQFDRPDPRQALKGDLRRIGELQDIERLAAYLQSRVASARTGIRVGREELLRDLGWESRLSQRFKHYFHVDESLYRAIEPTVNQLRRAIEDRKFGYVALLGGPGSGKSTTLSHTLRYTANVRLISYYAYIRNDLATGRGEAANFWQDIYLAIRQRGISPAGSMPRSASEFRKGVGEQLALLAEDWRTRGVLTVLLIDGLDHIDREQRPTESLIGQLPLPEQIPAGVIVCLGSQTLNLRGLAPSIAVQLGSQDRTLQMGRLTRADVFGMCESLSLPVPLTPEQKDLVHSRANGYPLATMYLLGRLMSTDSAEVDSLLQSDAPFSGDIEALYATYWNATTGTAVPDLLGLLCRMRVSFDIRDAVTWVPNLDAPAFIRQTKHFFQTVDGNKWSFFHNSFRQYLLRRTSEDLLGVYSDKLNRSQHLKLAGLAAEHDKNSAFGREVIFHLYEAADFKAVLALATQGLFRSQFFSLRNPRQVFDDIGLVVRAAKHELDGIALVRAWLIDRELHEREWCLDNASFRSSVDAFLDNQALLDSVRDQNGLLVPRKHAMACAKRLHESGAAEAASRIFDLAEPLDLLSGVEKVKLRDGERELLQDWLELAFTMRQPLAIADAIGNLVAEAFDASEESRASERLRRTLLIDLAAMTYERDEAAFKELLLHPDIAPHSGELAEHVDWQMLDGAHEPAVRASALSRILQSNDPTKYEDSERLFLAEQMCRHNFDRQRILEVVAGIKQPQLADPSKNLTTAHERRFHLFADRLRYNRLYSALGSPVSSEAAVPWPADKRLRNGARFERMIVVVANLWGAALGGRRYDDDVVKITLRDALRVFYSTNDNSDPSSNWYYYRAAAGEYFECLVLAVAAHGPSQLSALGREFDAIWAANEARSTWTADLRRGIAMALYKSGDGRDRLVARLDAIAISEVPPDDLQSRLDSLIESARSWQLAGEPTRAVELLEPTLKASFGIHHHKDRQFQQWVSWLDRATLAGAADPILECCRFGSALRTVVTLGRGRGSQEAASHLLAIATRADAAFGLHIRDQLFTSSTVSYGAACQGLVHGLLARPDCDPVQVAEFLALVGVAAEIPSVDELLARLVEALARGHDSPTVRAILEPLVAGVLVEEFSSARGAWLRNLQIEIERLGIDWLDLKVLAAGHAEEARSTPMTVKQRDGTSVVDRDFEKLIVDFDSLKAAIERAEPDSYFAWDRAARGIVHSATTEQLHALLQLLDQLGSRKHLVAAQIVDRLRQLGDLKLAELTATEFLETSAPHGWIEYFDGGTRLHIAKALVQINPARRPELFRLLADDYVGGLRNPRDLIMGLDDLLPIVFDEIPWDELWRQLSEHIACLSEFCESEPIPVPQLTEQVSAAALVESAVRDYQLPVPEMEIRFIRLLTSWLINPDTRELVVDSIDRALQDGMLDGQAVVPLFLARESLNKHSARLTGLLDRLDASPDISVRAYTRAILRGKFNPEDLTRDAVGDLPVLFQIALDAKPPSPSIIGLTPDFVQSTTSKPRAPAEFFRVWMPELEFVAKITAIPINNLLERAQQIADDVLGRSKWGANAEDFIRSYLAGIELKITFRRPWAQAGEIAVLCLLSELVDFELLDPKFILANDLVRYFDARLLRSRPVARPEAWVTSMEERSLGSGTGDWVERASSDLADSSFHRALPEGFVVLLEYSKFVRHDWEMPEERRTATLRTPGSPSPGILDKLSLVVPGYHHDPADLYPHRSTAVDSRMPAIGEYQFTLRVGPQRWFAINPAFARSRGLKFVDRDDFAWANKGGEVVARTIHWRDGPGRRPPPKLDDVFAEGWLVVMRRDALARSGNQSVFQLDRYVTRKASVQEDGRNNDITAHAHSTEVINL